MPNSSTLQSISNTPIEQLNYEQALTELEAIVEALENEERPLEEALALFERGQALTRYCTNLLDQAELKVQQISGDGFIDFNLQS